MKSNNSLKRMFINYLVVLVPFILYAFYKNGIFLFNNYDDSILVILKPLILLGISLGTGFILNKSINKKDSNKYMLYILGVISFLLVPVNVNYLVYVIGLLFSMILYTKYKKLNSILVFMLFIIIGSLILNNYSYLSGYDTSNTFIYNFINLLFGKSYGGIGSCNLILSIIAYIYLSYNSMYKKKIPLMVISSFIVTSCLFIPFIGGEEVYYNLFNSQVVFIATFIATISYSSPTMNKSLIVYSLIIGILGAILVNLGLVYEGLYISILIGNLIYIFMKRMK